MVQIFLKIAAFFAVSCFLLYFIGENSAHIKTDTGTRNSSITSNIKNTKQSMQNARNFSVLTTAEILRETFRPEESQDLFQNNKFNHASARKRKVPKQLMKAKIEKLRLNISREIQHLNSLRSRSQTPPLQIIIVTTWRSGSTFLAEVFESHPDVYYHYEPLLPFKMTNFYNETDIKSLKAQKLVQQLLKCKYDDSFLEMARLVDVPFFRRNKRLWEACHDSSTSNFLCFQRDFVEATCSRSPQSLMKLVRLGLKFIKPILEDKTLNPRVIFLVRDPRAVINSRIASVKWCTSSTCSDPSILCEHMEDDLRAFKELSLQFPERMHLIRYEDIALSPLKITKKLLNHINLDFHPNMQKYILSHTTTNIDSPWSTSRESSKRITFWTTKLKADNLNDVQTACAGAMRKFGYVPIVSDKNITVNDILSPMKSPLT